MPAQFSLKDARITFDTDGNLLSLYVNPVKELCIVVCYNADADERPYTGMLYDDETLTRLTSAIFDDFNDALSFATKAFWTELSRRLNHTNN